MANICVTLDHSDFGIKLLSLPIHKLRPGSIAIFVAASSIRNALYRKYLNFIAYNGAGHWLPWSAAEWQSSALACYAFFINIPMLRRSSLMNPSDS